MVTNSKNTSPKGCCTSRQRRQESKTSIGSQLASCNGQNSRSIVRREHKPNPLHTLSRFLASAVLISTVEWVALRCRKPLQRSKAEEAIRGTKATVRKVDNHSLPHRSTQFPEHHDLRYAESDQLSAAPRDRPGLHLLHYYKLFASCCGSHGFLPPAAQQLWLKLRRTADESFVLRDAKVKRCC
jgi:hypothetical protein